MFDCKFILKCFLHPLLLIISSYPDYDANFVIHRYLVLRQVHKANHRWITLPTLNHINDYSLQGFKKCFKNLDSSKYLCITCFDFHKHFQIHVRALGECEEFAYGSFRNLVAPGMGVTFLF